MPGLSRSNSGSNWATTSPSRPIAQNFKTVSPGAEGPHPATSVRTMRTTSAFERGFRPRNPVLGGASRGAIEAPLDSVTRLGEPAAREPGPLQAAPEIDVLAHHAPDQRAPVVFDHGEDRSLVDPEVVVGHPAEVADDAAVPELHVERERPIEGAEKAVLRVDVLAVAAVHLDG